MLSIRRRRRGQQLIQETPSTETNSPVNSDAGGKLATLGARSESTVKKWFSEKILKEKN